MSVISGFPNGIIILLMPAKGQLTLLRKAKLASNLEQLDIFDRAIGVMIEQITQSVRKMDLGKQTAAARGWELR